MARDNFKKSDIATLKDRVSSRCSNPSCRVPTCSAGESGKANIIGNAAHICAASKGGPRYDNTMSTEERKSIDNGIWLCANCATEIDKNVEKYDVECLHIWKQKAEESAIKELGKKLPAEDDTVNIMSSALTGLPSRFVPTALSNVHKATSQSLEALDSRFRVETSYINDAAQVNIIPKTEVSLSLQIEEHPNLQFEKKLEQLQHDGIDMELSSDYIGVTGSPLFEALNQKGPSSVKISSQKKKGTKKVVLVEKETGRIEAFDDLFGEVYCGTKTFTFCGTACNGIFKLSYNQPHHSGMKKSGKATLEISLNVEQWEGKSLRALPYLEKLYRFFERLEKGWLFSSSLEIDGLQIFKTDGIPMDDWDFVKQNARVLRFTYGCFVIAKNVEHEITFSKNAKYTGQVYRRVIDASERFEGVRVFRKSDITKPTTFTLSKFEGTRLINDKSYNTPTECYKMVEPESEILILFGKAISLPQKSTTIIGFRLESLIDEASEMIKFEIIPLDNYQRVEAYEVSTSK